MTGQSAAPDAPVVRASLLRIAARWENIGQVNQAIDAYTRLLRRYPATEEAQLAATRLLALAQVYERQGRYHLALSLYQKLDQAP